jgi:hypothetical protein
MQPGQVIYLQIGGISSRNVGIGAPNLPSYVSGVGRAEGSFGQGGISLVPQAMAEQMMQQAAQQEPCLLPEPPAPLSVILVATKPPQSSAVPKCGLPPRVFRWIALSSLSTLCKTFACRMRATGANEGLGVFRNHLALANDQLDLRFGLSFMESTRPVGTAPIPDDFGDFAFGMLTESITIEGYCRRARLSVVQE